MTPEFISSFDNTPLALHRLGVGRPLILLHGLFSTVEMNWVKFGHAQLLADAGFECLMPDLRGHGQSGKPHDASAYPDDVLARDLRRWLMPSDWMILTSAGFRSVRGLQCGRLSAG
jgi:pimeloyl-ACP methyl ester carboxylesterase